MMKPVKIKIAIRPMALPQSKALKAGRTVLAQFAHHPPVEGVSSERMMRPGKPHGPHNG